MTKIEKEKQMVEAMIRLYCRGKRHEITENGELKTENYLSGQDCLNTPNTPNTPNTLNTPKTTKPAPRSSANCSSANCSSAHPLTAHPLPAPRSALCPQCQQLLTYAHQRLERCKFGERKPSCTRCPVHCYKPAMREQIRQVMRYSGPRMLLHDPIVAIVHLWDFLRAKFLQG